MSSQKEVILDSEELLSFDVSTLDDEIYEVKLTDLMESIDIIEMDSIREAFTKIFRVTVRKGTSINPVNRM